MMIKMFDAIVGFIVGDALGVPYEFKERDSFKCIDMVGHGTHDQPIGTWSDDSSLMLATCYSIQHNNREIDLDDMMNRYCDWLYQGKFTNSKLVFDVGNTTCQAINNYAMKNADVSTCGIDDIDACGNGSLMRVLPLAFIDCGLGNIGAVSSLTHAHVIPIQACQIYVLIAKELLKGTCVIDAIKRVHRSHTWLPQYNRLYNIDTLTRDEIRSSGYVVDTLEAVLWCLVKTDNYKDCVLIAVNLGNDTDTIAALAGGLAGIVYGMKSIPEKWTKSIKLTANWLT